MPPRIEDYALIGDTHTAALVSKEGSIDWLCLPRFDSEASFAALLGNEENGRWQIAPWGDVQATRRRYRGETLVLETDFDTAEGSIRLVDFMPPRGEAPDVVRLVEGIRGRVRVHMDLRPRFDYGRIRPWLRHIDGAQAAIAGPDSVWLRTPVETRAEEAAVRADFLVSAGELVPFVLTWHPSHEPAPVPVDPLRALADTESFWTEWVSSCAYTGEWREAVVRSLLTLKALTYAPTGGIVAAPTTSLPEQVGGVRNWDYRYCWLRDAAITLLALNRAGFGDEAQAWHSWLLRVVAGNPADLQAVYTVAGERRLTEVELPWLSGYRGAKARADRQRGGRAVPARCLRPGGECHASRPPRGPRRGR
jgi:GH15 family glucan-1,4-alpha-glucosidase